MTYQLFPSRYSLLKVFVGLFLLLSIIVRLSLLVWNFSEVDLSLFQLLGIFLYGLLYDIATVSFFTIPYLLYLIVIPQRFYGSLLDRIIIYSGFSVSILIIFFSFFGEITFWDEFHRRFNFIAVDYLLYSYEVVKNINESYPLPILCSSIVLLVGTTIFVVQKLKFFERTFTANTLFKPKLVAALPWVLIFTLSSMFLTNQKAEFSQNRYNSELAKAGIYSFFSAFRNNEIPYTEFYKTITKAAAYAAVKEEYSDTNTVYQNPKQNSIYRTIYADKSKKSIKPNVIFICVESLSGDFLSVFGNKDHITPTLDSLANNSLFFENVYATGTRTIRGMEAVTLSVPPTPGRSIVKRENNQNLFTIGEVFRQKGYERNFFYGGDGYFDNMNTYFGGNGFNIVDRGRDFLLDKSITATRTNIEDSEVTFENVWGVCDMDIYNKVLKEANKAHQSGQPFFNFIMTTSNHKPYTYPSGIIDIASGSGRNGAVKYTDYAIGEFLKKAITQPWYNNTVIIIMSDHCANSAGRWELDVKNYHIPVFMINVPNQLPQKISKVTSQIDVFPTLFSLLNWEYESNFFGKDALAIKPEDERAFIGNYRKLGYLKENKVMILDEQKNAHYYQWNANDNSLTSLPPNAKVERKSRSYYEVADDLYRTKGLEIRKK